jgi:hypothetical protein
MRNGSIWNGDIEVGETTTTSDDETNGKKKYGCRISFAL